MLDMGMTIGGRQVAGQESFAVFNPATEEVIGDVTNASLDDLDRAVSAAKAAYPAWSALPYRSCEAQQTRKARVRAERVGAQKSPTSQ